MFGTPSVLEGDRRVMQDVFRQTLRLCLPSQMVVERDPHKSGTGRPAASVWGQPHYPESGSVPGCRDVSVYSLQHRGVHTQPESPSAVCL